jgi:hypothetical protein
MRSFKVKLFVDFHVGVLEVLSNEGAGLLVRIAPMLVFTLWGIRAHFTTKIKGFYNARFFRNFPDEGLTTQAESL